MTRFLVWTAIIGLSLYDMACEAFGWPTVTSVVRTINDDSGWLLAWGLAAIWMHWFLFALIGRN